MGYGAKIKPLRKEKRNLHQHKSSVRLLFYFLPQPFAVQNTEVEWEEPVKGLWRLHLHYIHSRCWLDLVEPGPDVLGAGFSCLFLQVWCLMLIPPHVPWVLSKHAGAGDSAGRPALSPACLLLSFCLPWWPTHPHCSSSKQPVLSSLPVIRVAALNGCPARTWEASFLYFL